MWRLILVFGLLLASAAPAAAQTKLGARVTQVDSSRYPDVMVYVSVTDDAGTPIGGLNASDFLITEDGQKVGITGFAGAGAPISVALVFDRSSSMDEAGKLEGAQKAARAFVRQLGPSDKAALIAFDDQPELVQGFTSDQHMLERAISRLHASGSTALYDSIVAAVEELQSVEGRRALIVLTDGRDRISVEDSSRASTHSLEEAIRTARNAGISAQVIGLGERTSNDPMAGIDEAVLQQIASETGGQYFYAPNAATLAELYVSLATAIRQEYQITYRSPRPFYDGTRRDVQVTVAGTATSGGYVEPHLIQVRSNPWVALALLIPVIGLLIAPRFVRRKRYVGDMQPAESPVTAGAATAPATTQTVDVTPHFCDQCGTKLRPGARFCAGCGARVVAPPSGEVV